MQPQTGECRGETCGAVLCEKMKRELRCFSFLSEVELDEISGYFNCRQVPARCNVWQSGGGENYAAFIVEGRIEIKVDTEFPGKQVVVGVFSRGSVIGIGSVLGSRPHRTTARVLDDAGLVILTRENFEYLLAAYPQVGIKLLKGMLLSETQRLSKAYSRLASLF